MSTTTDVIAVNGARSPDSVASKKFFRLATVVISRDRLLTDVWGYRYSGGTRTVDVHIRRLRKKLPTLTDSLLTVQQFGYKLLDVADQSARDAYAV
jgi:DNA-binding winged helix-turn-helix (wHTH) protein